MIKSPFKFLDSYTLADTEIFFGRDHEILELYRKIFDSKILLVYGNSGTGKSSLINCGLASRFDETNWLQINVRRGNNINASLNEAFNIQAIRVLDNTMSYTKKLQSIYLDHFKPIYIIFDQFEELFIFGNQEEKSDFIKLIKEIYESEIQCRIIFIIREEFLAGMTEFESDFPDIFTNRFRVEKMKRINAISAIEGPSKVNNIEIDSGFAEDLIDKLCPTGGDIELTYLQIYLDRIFNLSINERPETENIRFTKELLQKAGSVSDLLVQFLEEQISKLDSPDTGMAILKSFVSVQGTRRQMGIREIIDSLSTFQTVITEPDLLKYLTRFVDLRILRERDEAGQFELRHDSLASKIFEQFTAIEKDIIELKEFIENAWHNWEKRSVLLSSDDLKYIAPYENRLYLKKEISDLIEKSKHTLLRAKQRRRKILTIATVALLILLTGFTIWALKERNRAFQQMVHSKVLLLIAKAKEAADNDPTKAIRYAQLAYKQDSTNNLVNSTMIDILSETNARPFYSISYDYMDNISSAVFSPNGENVLISSGDKTAKLWDYSGKCLVTFSGHSDYVNKAVFSPDGEKILTASNDGTAKLWDLSGNCIITLRGHSSYVSSAIFSPDGSHILTTSTDKTARLWDLSGKCLAILSGHSESVISASYSSDGRFFLTLSLDKTVRIWSSSGNFLTTLTGHQEEIRNAVFSPDCKKVITGSLDKTAKLWDISGKCLATLSGHTSFVYSVALSPDGKKILTASHDNTAKLWNLSGECLVTFSGHTSWVLSAIFSPDGRKILTSSYDKDAKVWDLSGKCLLTLSGHTGGIYSAIYSDDEKVILTSSNDKTVKVWDLSAKCMTTLSGHNDRIWSIVFSSDDKLILTASNDKTAKIWNLRGECLLTLSDHTEAVTSAVFSPDGKSFLTSSEDKTARSWDISGKCTATLKGHTGWVHDAIYSPDGEKILTTSYDKTAKLWDLSGNCISTLEGHNSYVTSALFSPDGRYIITSSIDKTTKLWDQTGKYLMTLSGHKSQISSIDFSPDSKYIVTASFDGTGKLWDLSGNCIVTFLGHRSSVNSAVFSPNGRYMLTGSSDNTAKLWNLSGKCLTTLSSHISDVYSAVFSPDGNNIVTASNDNTIKLWNIDGKCIATFTGLRGYVYDAVYSHDGEKIATLSNLNVAQLWLTPSGLNKWLNLTKIGNLLPSDKAEIDELDDFNTIKSSNDLIAIINYVNWYLNNNDTIKAEILLEKIQNMNPKFLNKKILGDIYKSRKEESKYLHLYRNEPEAIIKDKILSLRDTSEQKNYKYKFKYYSDKANLYEELLKLDSSIVNKINASATYNAKALNSLLIRDYKSANEAIRRGFELTPSDPLLYKTLPLCFLFSNQFEKAREIYLEYKDMSFKQIYYKDAFLSDISIFEEEGIIHPDFEKVKDLLKK